VFRSAASGAIEAVEGYAATHEDDFIDAVRGSSTSLVSQREMVATIEAAEHPPAANDAIEALEG
jgi:hypothetical protein